MRFVVAPDVIVQHLYVESLRYGRYQLPQRMTSMPILNVED